MIAGSSPPSTGMDHTSRPNDDHDEATIEARTRDPAAGQHEGDEIADQPTTTRRELWAYYLYYNGDNGVGPGSYSQAL